MSDVRSRFYLPGAFRAGDEVVLDEARHHKLRNVLRARPGDLVGLFNAEAGEWRAEVTALDKKIARLRVTRRQRAPELQREGPWLCFSPIKAQRLDLIIEKATELGASRLVPVRSARCQIARINAQRMGEQAREAAEQSERLDVPCVDDYQTLADCMASWPAGRRLILCAEAGQARPLADFLLQEGINPTRQGDAIMIGPEGGFTPEELDGFAKLSFVSRVGLGPRLLRAETAAIAALGLWQAILGDGAARPAGAPKDEGQD